MNVEEAKKVISGHLKREPEINTPLGNLKVERQIGQGGNAVVYEADWGGSVAAKVLAEDSSSRRSERYDRFALEFREFVKLSHTGAVASMYHFGEFEAGGGVFPYVVMELCKGTLKDWAKANPVRTLADLLPVLRRILQCLGVVHERGIVHRDVKPENVLVANGDKLVLADFGIAWFDPDLYERNFETDKRGRMANWQFSAPEQFSRGLADPHATMDIYGVGQIVQWLVTGSTHRGTGRKPLREVHGSFAPLDPVVDAMLRNDPALRPQSVAEVARLIKDRLDRVQERRRRYEEEQAVLRALDKFDEALTHSFPGGRGLIRATDPEEIERLLRNLADLSGELKRFGLWWTQGAANLPINTMRHLGKGTWLMATQECRVREAWVNRVSGSRTRYHQDLQYVLLDCEPLPPFELDKESEAAYAEAAWLRDRYISREEYDDGVALVDGKVVVLEGEAELRVRNRERDFFFVGTQVSAVCWGGEGMRNDKMVMDVYDNFKDLGTSGEVTPALLEPLMSLDVHPTSEFLS